MSWTSGLIVIAIVAVAGGVIAYLLIRRAERRIRREVARELRRNRALAERAFHNVTDLSRHKK